MTLICGENRDLKPSAKWHVRCAGRSTDAGREGGDAFTARDRLTDDHSTDSAALNRSGGDYEKQISSDPGVDVDSVLRRDGAREDSHEGQPPGRNYARHDERPRDEPEFGQDAQGDPPQAPPHAQAQEADGLRVQGESAGGRTPLRAARGGLRG